MWASQCLEWASQVITSLGPVVLPNRLTGVVYHCFLVSDLPVPLEHAPLHQRQHMWFTHDEARPHFLRIVRQRLN
jgi:hypothetical protein